MHERVLDVQTQWLLQATNYMLKGPACENLQQASTTLQFYWMNLLHHAPGGSALRSELAH
jgi:hypothetical protein